MKSTTLVFLSALGSATAQGVTDNISPKGSPPAGCSGSFDGKFEVSVVDRKVSVRDIALKKRAACSGDGILVASLGGGKIVDAKARVGYIASNYQFQFDGPPQAGAIYTSGFSVCGNGSLALGSSTVFYKCQSGSFYNLYDRNWAAQCSAVQIMVMPCGGSNAVASQRGEGLVVATTVVPTTVVIPLSDGQPQVVTTRVTVPMCQIGDGQIQAHTTPCASVTAKPTSTAAPVSQFSDGQIQVTTRTPVSQISDGQVQVTTGASSASSTRGPSSSLSSVTRLTTAPSTTGSRPTGSANSTGLSTTARPTGSGSGSASAPPVSTVTQGSGAAKGLEMGSLAALAVGILGAVWFL